jgi:hypothetical protein
MHSGSATKTFSPCCVDKSYVLIADTTVSYNNTCNKNGGLYYLHDTPSVNIKACFCLTCRQTFYLYKFKTSKSCCNCNEPNCSLIKDMQNHKEETVA